MNIYKRVKATHTLETTGLNGYRWKVLQYCIFIDYMLSATDDTDAVEYGQAISKLLEDDGNSRDLQQTSGHSSEQTTGLFSAKFWPLF